MEVGMSTIPVLTLAVCTYNRCERLPILVRRCREQSCPVPFEVLVVNNNSGDDTLRVLENLKAEPGAPLRFVTEYQQGIVSARNRAISEALEREYLVFIDDDELPREGFLAGAIRCFETYPSALCVGGRVKVAFSQGERPGWLNDDLLGFLAETDYGDKGFWVENEKAPLWTANIAYRMKVFREHPDLRFDYRYDRVGKGIGGGEDVVMFRQFLRAGFPMRYCPDMVADHGVEPWRLRPSYFLKLHCKSGFNEGRWELADYQKGFFGIPLFLFRQLLVQMGRTFSLINKGQPGVLLRQAMTAVHALGMIFGSHVRWRDSHFKPAR
jgi:glycosyltransferase involved in cell wall biosynthesis